MSPSTRVLNESEPSAPLGCGRIDIHSHLLPGLDDGCTDVSESLACVQHLIEAGHDGSICTPHIWPDYYPQNTAAHIEKWTRQLQVQIQNAGLAYQLWPGGELRLFDGMIEWMQGNSLCMTGKEGFHANASVREFISARRYQFVALDMHGLDTRCDRLDGIRLIEEQFGHDTLDRLTIDAPRRLILEPLTELEKGVSSS